MCQVLLKLAQRFWRRFFKCCQCIFIIIFTWKMVESFIWTPKECLSKVWAKLEISPVVFERFLNFINVFSLFLQYLSLRRMWPFISTNYNFFRSMMLCANSGWNWPSGSREEICAMFGRNWSGDSEEDENMKCGYMLQCLYTIFCVHYVCFMVKAS